MPDDLTFTPETSPELAEEIRRRHHPSMKRILETSIGPVFNSDGSETVPAASEEVAVLVVGDFVDYVMRDFHNPGHFTSLAIGTVSAINGSMVTIADVVAGGEGGEEADLAEKAFLAEHDHGHFHEHQVKAFELYAPAAEQGFPDTEGVDPGPWYFWFKVAANDSAD